MDTDPDLPVDKTSLIDRILRDRHRLETAVHGLSEDELALAGSDGWSIKDHLAHVAAWERSLVGLLRGDPRWEAMGLAKEVYVRAETDEMNAALHARHSDQTALHVLAEFRRAHEELLDTLGKLTDEALLLDYRHYQPDEPGDRGGHPVVAWVRGNTFEHYEEHAEWIRRLRDQLGLGEVSPTDPASA